MNVTKQDTDLLQESAKSWLRALRDTSALVFLILCFVAFVGGVLSGNAPLPRIWELLPPLALSPLAISELLYHYKRYSASRFASRAVVILVAAYLIFSTILILVQG